MNKERSPLYFPEWHRKLRYDRRFYKLMESLEDAESDQKNEVFVEAASDRVFQEMQINGGGDEQNTYYDSHDAKDMKMDQVEPFWRENFIRV